MGNSAKIRNGVLSSLKIATSAFVVLISIISINSVHSASISNTTLPGECVHRIDSRGVVISCTSYSQIPTNLANSETVWYLHMENGNSIGTLKNGSLARSKLKALEYLNLRFCKIRVVEPGAFAGSRLLLRIYLSSNLITVLNPDIFKDIPSLRVLRIDKNPITKIEDGKTFPNFTELIRLDLSNCKLESICSNIFANLNSLRTLKLNGNNLKHLDWRVLQRKNNLTILSLKNNPWHCDCHVKFLMDTLKNMSLAKAFKSNKCGSADTPKWKGRLWNQVPKEDMTCQPEINSLVVYSSWSPLSQPSENGDIDRLYENETLHFDCEYSGFPKPEVQWFKDNQLVMRNLTESSPTQPKIEFLNDTSSALQNLKQGEEIFGYKFKSILVVHQIKGEDKGTYTCVVVHNHVTAHKTVTLPEIKIFRKEEGFATFEIWDFIIIFMGLLLGFLTAAMTVIAWINKRKQGKKRIIKETRVDLAEFDIQPCSPEISEDTTDTSVI